MKNKMAKFAAALLLLAGAIAGVVGVKGDPSQWGVAGDPSQWEAAQGDPSQWGVEVAWSWGVSNSGSH